MIGEYFKINATEVYKIIVKFTGQNESKNVDIQSQDNIHNRRLDNLYLLGHFDGFRVLGIYITWSEQIMDKLLYMVKKCPQMWRYKFER